MCWGSILSLLSIVRAENPHSDSVREAVERSLHLIRFNFEKDLKNIVIKPNLCYYYDYSTGETTDPKFVSALVDVLREHLPTDPQIFIVESDASAVRCKHVFKMLGYVKMAKEKDVTLVNLSEEKNQITEVKIVDKYFRFRIPQTIRQSDLLVNIPKIKYQLGVKMTCALKNIYGCNAYPKKYVYHRFVHEAIVGINKLIKSNLVVVDGIIVAGIETRKLGLIMASEDPVAIDSAASMILGMNPKSIKQIALAEKEGIGCTQFVPKGEPLDHIRNLFPRRKMKNKIRGLLASTYLRVMK